MRLKVLNNTQKKQAIQLLSIYKYIYVCNECGIIYGTDKKENKNIYCPKCSLKIKKEDKK